MLTCGVGHAPSVACALVHIHPIDSCVYCSAFMVCCRGGGKPPFLTAPVIVLTSSSVTVSLTWTSEVGEEEDNPNEQVCWRHRPVEELVDLCVAHTEGALSRRHPIGLVRALSKALGMRWEGKGGLNGVVDQAGEHEPRLGQDE